MVTVATGGSCACGLGVSGAGAGRWDPGRAPWRRRARAPPSGSRAGEGVGWPAARAWFARGARPDRAQRQGAAPGRRAAGSPPAPAPRSRGAGRPGGPRGGTAARAPASPRAARRPGRPTTGCPDRLQVDPDLVGAPGLEAGLQQGEPPQLLEAAQVGHRLTAVRGRRPTSACGRRRSRPTVRSIVSAGGAAPCTSVDVAAVDLPIAHQPLEAPVGARRAGHHQQPRGVAVETVHDARPHRVAPAGDVARRAARGPGCPRRGRRSGGRPPPPAC